MKRRILITLLVLALMCTCLIGSSVLRATEPDPELNIAACNLSFSDSVYIKYGVQGDDLTGVKLLVWTTPQTVYEYGTQQYLLSSNKTESIQGVNSLVFTFNKFAAKQMTDVVYARAYVEKSGVKYYSEVKKYSILQYVYNKTGKTGTATSNQNLINLLNGMIEYGSLAQTYFIYKTDRLATLNWYQVKVIDGTLDDMCTHGLYLPGDEVTLIAPETNDAGQDFSYWKNKAGEIIGTSATIDVVVGTSNEVYTAVYGEEIQTAFTVKFIDYDGSLLKECTVESGNSAVAPVNPYRAGYLFTGWDTNFSSVSSDLTVTAQYDVNNDTTLTVKSVETNGEGTVQVEIMLDNNPGILGMSFAVHYDSSKLALTSATNGEAVSVLTLVKPGRFKDGCVFSWDGESISGSDIKDGTVLTLTFSVNETVSDGNYSISVAYNEGDIFDNDLNFVTVKTVEGVIAVQR